MRHPTRGYQCNPPSTLLLRRLRLWPVFIHFPVIMVSAREQIRDALPPLGHLLTQAR